eukprot:6931826-Prymnesium_polylepis.1
MDHDEQPAGARLASPSPPSRTSGGRWRRERRLAQQLESAGTARTRTRGRRCFQGGRDGKS